MAAAAKKKITAKKPLIKNKKSAAKPKRHKAISLLKLPRPNLMAQFSPRSSDGPEAVAAPSGNHR